MMNHPICDEPRQRGPDFSKALRHRPSSDSFERACSFAPTHAPPSFPEHSPASIIARALTPSARNPIFVTTNGVAMRWTCDPDKAAANRLRIFWAATASDSEGPTDLDWVGLCFDAVAAWMDECCQRDPTAWERIAALFASWSTWADN